MLCSPYVLAERTEGAVSACALTGWVTVLAVHMLVKEPVKCPACQGPLCRRRTCRLLFFGELASQLFAWMADSASRWAVTQQENAAVIAGCSHFLVSRSCCGAYKHLSCTLTVTNVCWVTAILCFLLLGVLLLKSVLPSCPQNSDCLHLAFKTSDTEILALCVDGSGLGTRQPAEQSPPISEMVTAVSCVLCLHEKNFS